MSITSTTSITCQSTISRFVLPDDFPKVGRLIFGKAEKAFGSKPVGNEKDEPSCRSHVVRENLPRRWQDGRLEVDVEHGGQEHQVEDQRKGYHGDEVGDVPLRVSSFRIST